MSTRWLPTLLLCAASAIAVGAGAQCNVPGNGFVNCGFETGNFAGWQAADLTGNWVDLQVVGAGISAPVDLFAPFSSLPTEGTMAALHGFDGQGPGTIELAQDIRLDPAATNLTFDYRAGWDITYNSPTTARTAVVEIQPAGGGAALSSTTYLTAPAGNRTNDTGPLNGAVDVSAFAGQDVRIVFKWNVPEAYTGPGQFQLDNVFVLGIYLPLPFSAGVPANSPWSLLALIGLLSVLGYRRLRMGA